MPFERIGARVIVLAVIAVMLIAAVLFGLSECSRRQTADKRAEVSKEQGQASIGAGTAAIDTVANVAASDAATDAQVAQGQAAIHAAPEGQKGKAARSAACSMKTYRDTPECKEPPK